METLTKYNSKVCKDCAKRKPFRAFWNNDKMRDGKFSSCMECGQARNRRWHKDNPVRRKQLNIYSNAVRQGVKHPDIIVWYDQQLERQGGKCAMSDCNTKAEDNTFGRLYIDHDHTTGAPRGLLCNDCNWKLGFYETQKERFSVFDAYLVGGDDH